MTARTPAPGEKTVSIRKAAEATGASVRTIYHWLATGKVEYVRTAGGAVRIFWRSLWRDHDGTAFREP